jgi:hypothetical protein
MQYQMIRAALGYRAMVIITPSGAHPETPEAHCFMWSEWAIGDRVPHMWHAISALEATLLYSGDSSKGWGFADVPTQAFDSLEHVTAWVSERKTKKAI